ncbi:MAG: UPF0182 family protein, partial [Chloroflexota bacterium]
MTFFKDFDRQQESSQPPWDDDSVVEGNPPERKKGGIGWMVISGAIFLLFLVASSIKGIYTDWLWFDNLGFSDLFLTPLLTRTWLFLAGAALFFVLAMGNIILARRLSPKPSESFVLGEGVVILARTLNMLVLVGVAAFSFIMGSIVSEQWESVLRFLNAKPFGVDTPVLGGDVSFYMFTVPVYRFIEMWLAGSLILILLGTLVVYGFNFGMNRFSLSFPAAVKGHLSALGAGIFLLLSWGYWLDIFDLAYSSRGVVFGPSYTDVHAQWFGFQILMVVAVICAVLLVANVFRRGVRLPLIGIGLWIASGIVFAGIYPTMVQKLEVEPNELGKERPYI